MSQRELELEAKLQQKNDELEGRNKLLEKTRVAIDTLKTELVRVKQENEQVKQGARKMVEERSSRVQELEEDLRTCEEDLEEQTANLSRAQASLAEAAARADALQTKVDDLEQAHLTESGDSQVQEQTIKLLKSRLEESQEQGRHVEAGLRERNAELGELGRVLKEVEDALEDTTSKLEAESARVAKLVEARDQRDRTIAQRDQAIAQLEARLGAAEGGGAEMGKRLEQLEVSHVEELRRAMLDAERREAEASARENALDIRHQQLAEELEADKDAVVALKQQMKSQLEAKVMSIAERLQGFADREAKLEGAIAALGADLDVARKDQAAEYSKRTDLERALREAAGLFKKEMWAKNEALEELQGQVAELRAAHARSLESAAGRYASVTPAEAEAGEWEGGGGGGLALEPARAPAAAEGPAEAGGRGGTAGGGVLEGELESLARVRESYQVHAAGQVEAAEARDAASAVSRALNSSALLKVVEGEEPPLPTSAPPAHGLCYGAARPLRPALPPPPSVDLGSVYSSDFGRQIRDDVELSCWHEELTKRLGSALQHMEESQRKVRDRGRRARAGGSRRE